MRFKVTHTTRYKYRQPASESFAELRVWPGDTPSQKIISRQLKIEPEVTVDSYTDYFGNRVEFFSVPFRHNALSISAIAEVKTLAVQPPKALLDTPLGEARQLFNSHLYRHYDFLQSTPKVPLHGLSLPEGKRFFREAAPIGECLLKLNRWIYKNFSYTPGATDIATPLPKVLAMRKGVCQDFAHLMLAILRANGLPARYVSGYIEAYDPEQPGAAALTGAAASHAWVEALLPGDTWWGLDPTNDQTAGERHVTVAVGRDYDDVAPMRGTYKGAQDQRLQVIVSLRRRRTPARKTTTQPSTA